MRKIIHFGNIISLTLIGKLWNFFHKSGVRLTRFCGIFSANSPKQFSSNSFGRYEYSSLGEIPGRKREFSQLIDKIFSGAIIKFMEKREEQEKMAFYHPKIVELCDFLTF